MKLVRPITIDAGKLSASNVAASAVAGWLVGTTYATGNQVLYLNRVYQSLQNSNLGKQPDTNPTWWTDLGPENRFAMFDDKTGTQTSNTTSIVVTIRPGARIDTLALLNISAATARVKVTSDAAGVIFDQTYSLAQTAGIGNFWDWFFEPIRRKSDLIVAAIPPYQDISVEVTLTDTGNTVKCGSCILGLSTLLGSTRYGASLGIQDYSAKTVDAFGSYTIVQRSFAKRGNFQINVDNTQVDYVANLLAGYRTTPLLWIGADEYAMTAIFGFFKDFNVEIQYLNRSLCSLEIEGLT